MLEWDEKFSTGLEEIDHQHKMCFHLLNAMERELKHQGGTGNAPNAITVIEQYIRQHFGLEEMCIHGIMCPEAIAVRTAHQDLLKALGEFDELSKKNGWDADLLFKLHQFLESWFSAHILKVDSKIKACQASQGRPPTIQYD